MNIKYHSWLIDKKINGINVSFDMSAGEYVVIAKDILTSNQYQRRKIDSHGKIYDLLKIDLLDGCVMPPIILSTTTSFNSEIYHVIERAIKSQADFANAKPELERLINRAVEDKKIIILDGLQRTYTILDCEKIAIGKGDKQEAAFKQSNIRFEIYIGLQKTGVLYRMLTLNTGQTPMSFRQQIEILYCDFIDRDDLPDGIVIVTEKDERRARGLGKYKYQDVVDMFYAYTTASPKPHDRLSLVSQVKELLFLEEYKQQDDILEILTSYNQFVSKINTISYDWTFDQSRIERDITRPFGVSVESVFSKSQAMTGFGSEIKKLQKQSQIGSIADIKGLIDDLRFNEDPHDALNNMIVALEQVTSRAKKVGEAQRLYFSLCFYQIFNKDSDSFLDLDNCWLAALEKFEMIY
ncbi:hypothetical protein [Solidesulfovibrio sp. C21]|uniref:hypothetical protein n=1 Tax=Solidesulfovibrio sp. C21 TaxID=3398613 RepID=UPI0039FC2964